LSSGKWENINPEKVYTLNVELSNNKEVESLEPVEYVFHVGAPSSIVQFTGDIDNKLIDWGINGFYNLLKYCKKNNVKKLTWASSATYYGKQEAPLIESKPTQPANVYGFTKAASEVIMNLFPDMNHTGLRIFPAYGPYEEHKHHFASVPYIFLKQMMKGEKPVIWGDGKQVRDFIYIDDLVELIIKTAVSETDKYLNIGTGIGQSYNKLVDDINIILETNVGRIYETNPYGDAYLNTLVADVTLMKEQLGTPKVSFEDGLRKTSEWIKEY
ncbi:unnamed protein product, partial [marine sediment metagenome]